MKRKKMLAALVCVMALVVGGCGDQPITLTEEEQAAIVYYSAHVVSKYNTRQPDGLTHVPPEDLEEATEDVIDADIPESASDTEVAGDDTPVAEDSEADAPVEPATLTEALGLVGITAEYVGVERKEAYREGEYLSIEAQPGNVILVVTVALNNPTDEDVECNILNKKFTISAIIDKQKKVPAMLTASLKGLSTFDDVIPAGETVDTILLFEVSEEISEANGLELSVK